MTPTCETRPRSPRAGPVGLSFRKGDSTGTSLNNFEFQAADRARRQFLVHALYRLGEYPLFHFIAETERGGGINETPEIYAELDARLIAALGGHDFPPSVRSIAL